MTQPAGEWASSPEEIFFLLYAAWVRSRAERPSVSYTKVGFFLLYAAWVRSRAERPSVSYTKVVMEVAWTGHNLQFTKTN